MESLQQMLAVLFVLGLLGGSLWWLRRRGLASFAARPRRKNVGALQSVERLALSPGHSLHLVRVADRAILIAASPSGCRVMETLPWSSVKPDSEERA
jgi:flagellar biosynthetic protein FliO